MIADLVYTTKQWRLVHLIGIMALRARYARSKFGQAWLTLTTFIQILCAGLVWSLIWRMEISEYLPYVGAGHIIYLFLSQTINESSGIFIADARLYINDKLPFMISIGAHIYRNILILLHNIPTIILLIWWSPTVHPHVQWTYLPSMVLALLFVTFSSYFIAILCTRFRDLIQLVGLFLQLAFLVSPIMWRVSFLPEQYQPYVFLNPFAAWLDLLRNPLLGLPVSGFAWISVLVWTSLALLLAALVHKTMSRHLIYWI